jgi:hypothetical protein
MRIEVTAFASQTPRTSAYSNLTYAFVQRLHHILNCFYCGNVQTPDNDSNHNLYEHTIPGMLGCGIGHLFISMAGGGSNAILGLDGSIKI